MTEPIRLVVVFVDMDYHKLREIHTYCRLTNDNPHSPFIYINDDTIRDMLDEDSISFYGIDRFNFTTDKREELITLFDSSNRLPSAIKMEVMELDIDGSKLCMILSPGLWSGKGFDQHRVCDDPFLYSFLSKVSVEARNLIDGYSFVNEFVTLLKEEPIENHIQNLKNKKFDLTDEVLKAANTISDKLKNASQVANEKLMNVIVGKDDKIPEDKSEDKTEDKQPKKKSIRLPIGTFFMTIDDPDTGEKKSIRVIHRKYRRSH